MVICNKLSQVDDLEIEMFMRDIAAIRFDEQFTNFGRGNF